MSMSFFGIKLRSVAFSGITEEGTAKTVYDFERHSNFKTAGVSSNGLYAYKGVATGDSGDATHGLCPASAWAAVVQIPEESYIVYRLQAENGYVFSELEIAFSAKLWSQNLNECYANNTIDVYASVNAEDFGSPLLTCKVADNKSDYTLDLTKTAAGRSVLYVKIELREYIQSCNKHNYTDFASDADFCCRAS